MKKQIHTAQQSQRSSAIQKTNEFGRKGTAQLVDNRKTTTNKQVLQQKMHTNTTSIARPIKRKTNKTGLPDNLKSGIENLSGYSMDDVKVHYNSNKPAQLQAHAYAQGTDIHLASGQEKHLPHEAWHVVQQKQGRVQPTRQLKSKVNINDDAGLEKEADVMGAKANNYVNTNNDYVQIANKHIHHDNKTIQRVRFEEELINSEKPLRAVMVGEKHLEIDRKKEQAFWKQRGVKVYYENESIPYTHKGQQLEAYPDDPLLRIIFITPTIESMENMWLEYSNEKNVDTKWQEYIGILLSMYKDCLNYNREIMEFNRRVMKSEAKDGLTLIPDNDAKECIKLTKLLLIAVDGFQGEQAVFARKNLLEKKRKSKKLEIAIEQVTFLDQLRKKFVALKKGSRFRELNQTIQNVSAARSEYMLQTMKFILNNESSPFIYKVGQQHLNDLDQEEVDNKLLLVNRIDYNNEYETRIKQHKTKLFIDMQF